MYPSVKQGGHLRGLGLEIGILGGLDLIFGIL